MLVWPVKTQKLGVSKKSGLVPSYRAALDAYGFKFIPSEKFHAIGLPDEETLEACTYDKKIRCKRDLEIKDSDPFK